MDPPPWRVGPATNLRGMGGADLNIRRIVLNLFSIENFSDFSGKIFLKNEIKAKMWHIRFRVFFVLYSNFFLKTAHTFY